MLPSFVQHVLAFWKLYLLVATLYTEITTQQNCQLLPKNRLEEIRARYFYSQQWSTPHAHTLWHLSTLAELKPHYKNNSHKNINIKRLCKYDGKKRHKIHLCNNRWIIRVAKYTFNNMFKSAYVKTYSLTAAAESEHVYFTLLCTVEAWTLTKKTKRLSDVDFQKNMANSVGRKEENRNWQEKSWKKMNIFRSYQET